MGKISKHKSDVKYVYVYVQEHYHFPTDMKDMNGDMVAATPMHVCAGTDTGRITLKTRAKEAAAKLSRTWARTMEKPGEIHEHENGNEYRVWVDWPIGSYGYERADRFVYVVRRVTYTPG